MTVSSFIARSTGAYAMKDSRIERAGLPPAEATNSRSIKIERIPFDRPWEWLAAGWSDLWHQPASSLAYGTVASLFGLVLSGILFAAGFGALVPVLAGGFALVGPLLAVGLYEKSRRMAANEPLSFRSMLEAARQSAGRLGLFAAALLIIYLVWIRLAFLLLMLFLGPEGLPPVRDFMSTLLFTPHGLGLLIVGTMVGALLAALVFAMSVVSIPLLMERNVDAFTAMASSARAVAENPSAMGLWAALVAGFIGLGLLTLGIGLVVVFPLIGHATWHAYRDVVTVEAAAKP